MWKTQLRGIGRMVLSGLTAITIDAPQPSTTEGAFAGQYSELKPEQQRLVDDWFKRFSQTVKKPVNPADGYKNVRLSEKTTFNAVTHALLTTVLTDHSGQSLGSAIQIIDKLDNLAGKVPGASGDAQFRIYVQLKSGALDLLSKSKEFKRAPDNTIFHKGYPISYRSKPVVPSIQVSATKDGRLADIDVDYRSSSFPVALFNGHLTASNSDVRAGNNDQRHNQRWEGLPNWWRSLLGLPLLEQGKVGAEAGILIPKEPKVKGKAKPEEAIFDFLTSWLIEQKPNEALAYLEDNAYACMEVEQGNHIDRGMAQFQMLTGLQGLNTKIGKISDLSQASVGVRLTGPRVKVIPQSYEAEFVLYDVREDLAEQFKCVNKLNPEQASPKAAQSKKFGKYVGAVFRLKSKGQQGETVAMLWAKKGDYWTLISYEVEPEFDKYRVPNLATTIAVPPLEYVKGDPELIKAADDFLKKWFVLGQEEAAAQYISTKCSDCIDLYRSDDTPAPKNKAEAQQMLLAGMKRLASAAGETKKLQEAIQPASPHHPDLKLVRHSEQKAFVIVSVPDGMAALADCSKRTRGEEADFTEFASAKNDRNFYAVGFRLARAGDDTAVLWLIWAKESAGWKVISYVVVAP